MTAIFKYLKVITAIVLLLCTILDFVHSFIVQSKAMLDGPLANYTSYAFAFNDIILAGLLATVLFFDFKICLPAWGNLFMKVVGVCCIVLSLLGFVFIAKQQVFAGTLLLFAELYLFQLAYLLVSILVLGIGMGADWALMHWKDQTRA